MKRKSLAIRAVVVALAAAAGMAAADVTGIQAPVPPMGWNSWDAYGTTVTEAEVKANADYMAARLAPYGWQYIVVDIQWSDPNAKAHGYRPNAELAMDEYGRLIPAVNRFPSSANGRGFKPLADYVHSKGLKFGIHIMRGIPRQAVRANLPVKGTDVRAADIADTNSVCSWNTDMYGLDMKRKGAQEYYDSIVSMYAGWGVDYIKADDILRPLHRDEVAAVRLAIQRSGRPIVLSLSPGAARIEDAAFLQQNAQLWRVSDDFWDRWQDLRHAFDLLAQWAPYCQQGAWPDGDMLPLGRIGIRAERGDDRQTRFTRDEQRTLITLWSIARSPLMFGGDLPSLDDFTLSLIANHEVLAPNSRGSNSKQLFARDTRIAWVSDAGPGAKYLAVFNVGDKEPLDIQVSWQDLGLSGRCRVRDLWEHKDLGVFADGGTFNIPPHGAGMYKVEAAASR